MAKRGRPTVFSTEKAKRAYELAAIGATDREIAADIGISEWTFYSWRLKLPQFSQAVERGKEIADARIERSLYHRALGYSHPSVKIFMPAGATAPVYAEYVEHYPPDTAAATLWLKNRQPEKWRDRVDHEHSGSVSVSVTTGVPEAEK